MERSTGPTNLFSPKARLLQGDHQVGGVVDALIDSEDAVVSDFDTSIGLQTSEGALDLPAPVIAPRLAAISSTNQFLKMALE